MSRKSLLVAVGVVAALVVGGALTLIVLLLHEPGFYTTALVADEQARKRAANEFWGQCNDIINAFVNPEKPWEASFTEEQINSYFAEHLSRVGGLEKVFPDGMAAPRVAIEGDRIRLAFRYGTKPWSTIISIDFRVWLAQQEVNVVAVEVLGMRAGAVPIAAQSMLERFSDSARRQEVDVSWYRYNGHPVALLRFQGASRSPTVQLLQLSLSPHVLSVGGQPFGYTPPKPAPAATPAPAPAASTVKSEPKE
jgi:hypothetical protein